jgi:hypothetical protein
MGILIFLTSEDEDSLPTPIVSGFKKGNMVHWHPLTEVDEIILYDR